MVCPCCGIDRNFVVKSTTIKDRNKKEDVIYRFRECMNCHQKFKTVEKIVGKGIIKEELLG